MNHDLSSAKLLAARSATDSAAGGSHDPDAQDFKV
jgi:hypothetical protein